MSNGPAQGLAYFPGVNQLVAASGALGHGISPSTFLLSLAPQADFAGAGGTLSLVYDTVEIDLPDCKVDRHSLERNAAGLIWRLTILDRRWKWAFGGVAGFYNQRNDDGTIKDGSEQTPQRLAALLLDAMDEEDYDVDDLPNDQRPATEWELGRFTPAQYLSDLCAQLGCRVVLELFTNRVALRVIGQGEELPEDDMVLDNSLTIDPPEQPDTLAIVCGPDRYQNDWLLEPVALETDGTLVPVDSVSYKPAGGWSASDIPEFFSVAPEFRAKARASVYRFFRLVVPDEIVDVDDEVESLEQVLPLEREQVDTTTVSDALGNQVTANKPAAVYGSWFDWETSSLLHNNIDSADIEPDGFENTPTEYKRPFRIDRARGLVIFGDYVYANALDTGDAPPAGLQPGPPTLYLRVACSVRDTDTLAPTRYTRERDESDEFDTPTRYIRRDEITHTHVPVYGADYEILDSETNQDDVDEECDYYLGAAEQEYQTTYPQTIKYVGLRDDIELDGAIQQIEIAISRRGTTLSASRNDEQAHRFVSFQERRLRENAAKINQIADNGRGFVLRQQQRLLKGS